MKRKHSKRPQLTLRQVRELRDYTKKEVSQATGISVKSLQRWEKDSRKMPCDKFLKLIKHYGISSDFIYIGHEETAPIMMFRPQSGVCV